MLTLDYLLATQNILLGTLREVADGWRKVEWPPYPFQYETEIAKLEAVWCLRYLEDAGLA